MARSGFTAISSGRIKFGKDGRWYSDDEPIPNRAINRLFSRTLKILPDGRARLELGEDKAEVAIDIPRPRSVDVLTADEFIAIKRRIMALIHEEAVRAMS